MASEPSRELIGTTMLCRHIDDLVIVVHKEQELPSDVEWENYLYWCKALLTRHRALKVLVVPGERPPTAKQRSLYNKEIPGDSVRIAVLITGRHVLVIVKVFAWFVRNIKAFERNDVPGALNYLEVAPNPAIMSTILEFRETAKAVATSPR